MSALITWFALLLVICGTIMSVLAEVTLDGVIIGYVDGIPIIEVDEEYLTYLAENVDEQGLLIEFGPVQ